jgi:hypothetical protein
VLRCIHLRRRQSHPLVDQPRLRQSHLAIVPPVRILLCMRLIVAEKPSVGRDIASALGRHRKDKGYLAGEGWTVTWALGHLAELAPPDAYGEEYKKWRLES